MNKFVWFLAGAVVGAGGTYFALRSHFENQAADEIAEMRDYYRSKINKEADEADKKEQDYIAYMKEKEASKEDKDSYEKIRHPYGQYFRPLNSPPPEEGEVVPDPFVDKNCNAYDGIYLIKPEEYGQLDGYHECTCTWYAGDKILADEEDEPIDFVSATVGETFMDHFGDYAEGVVHVRNERNMSDYEITYDSRMYDDLYPEKHVHEMPDLEED